MPQSQLLNTGDANNTESPVYSDSSIDFSKNARLLGLFFNSQVNMSITYEILHYLKCIFGDIEASSEETKAIKTLDCKEDLKKYLKPESDSLTSILNSEIEFIQYINQHTSNLETNYDDKAISLADELDYKYAYLPDLLRQIGYKIRSKINPGTTCRLSKDCQSALSLCNELIDKIATNETNNQNCIDCEFFGNGRDESKEAKTKHTLLLYAMVKEAIAKVSPINFIVNLMLTNLEMVDKIKVYLLNAAQNNQREMKDSHTQDLIDSMHKEMIVFATSIQVETSQRLREITKMKEMDSVYVSKIVQNFSEKFNKHFLNLLEICTKYSSLNNKLARELHRTILDYHPKYVKNLTGLCQSIKYVLLTNIPNFINLKVDQEQFSEVPKNAGDSCKNQLMQATNIIEEREKVMHPHQSQPTRKRKADTEKTDGAVQQTFVVNSETDIVKIIDLTKNTVKIIDLKAKKMSTHKMNMYRAARALSFDDVPSDDKLPSTSSLLEAHSSQNSSSSKRQLDL